MTATEKYLETDGKDIPTAAGGQEHVDLQEVLV